MRIVAAATTRNSFPTRFSGDIRAGRPPFPDPSINDGKFMPEPGTPRHFEPIFDRCRQGEAAGTEPAHVSGEILPLHQQLKRKFPISIIQIQTVFGGFDRSGQTQGHRAPGVAPVSEDGDRFVPEFSASIFTPCFDVADTENSAS